MMTTIAWDGRFLAADGFTMRNGTLIKDQSVKLYLRGDLCFAFCGQSHWAEQWADWGAEMDGRSWVRDSSLDGPVTALGGDEMKSEGLVMVKAGKASLIAIVTPYPVDVPPNTAWGSGTDVAIGALDAGANAMRAIEIASYRDSNTGGLISFFDSQHPERGVREWDGEAKQQHLREWWTKDIARGRSTPEELVDEPPMFSNIRLGELQVNTGKHAKIRGRDYFDIQKPRQQMDTALAKMVWGAECAGRLVSGDGCGRCLRCNREWYALQKRPHRMLGQVTMRISAEVAAETLRLFPRPCAPISASDVSTAPLWVQQWNWAIDDRNTERLNELMLVLKTQPIVSDDMAIVDDFTRAPVVIGTNTPVYYKAINRAAKA